MAYIVRVTDNRTGIVGRYYPHLVALDHGVDVRNDPRYSVPCSRENAEGILAWGWPEHHVAEIVDRDQQIDDFEAYRGQLRVLVAL